MADRTDSLTWQRTDSFRARTGAARPVRNAAAPVRPPRFQAALTSSVEGWLADGKGGGWSAKTIKDRRQSMARFGWWLQHEAEVDQALETVTPNLIRAFLAYTRDPNPVGRFGNNAVISQRAARPATANAYFRILRAFFNFCIAEGWLKETPLKNVKAPKIPKDQIEPFKPDQVQKLLDMARRSQAPERNVAILFMLVDTGMRIGELCSLTMKDVDRGSGQLTVTGKGNKRRSVYMGTACRRALWRYLEAERRDALEAEPLFVAVGGTQTGSAVAYSGVLKMIQQAAKLGGIKGVRPSPHTLRHSFAVSFLKNGGNLLELQLIMGHEDMTMLQRYVKLAQQDLWEAHRGASPADGMKLR